MLTIAVITLLAMFALIIAPWIGSVNTHKDLHPTDLMAGDEGEDDPTLLVARSR